MKRNRLLIVLCVFDHFLLTKGVHSVLDSIDKASHVHLQFGAEFENSPAWKA